MQRLRSGRIAIQRRSLEFIVVIRDNPHVLQIERRHRSTVQGAFAFRRAAAAVLTTVSTPVAAPATAAGTGRSPETDRIARDGFSTTTMRIAATASATGNATRYFRKLAIICSRRSERHGVSIGSAA